MSPPTPTKMRLLILMLVAATALVAAVSQAWAVSGTPEVPGNPGNAPSWTFKNYRNESHRGANLTDHQPVLVSCRVKGAVVSDGDVWWYRIAQSPWDNRYYVSADDFYNDGRSTGSLKGTPFFDPKVPLCR